MALERNGETIAANDHNNYLYARMSETGEYQLRVRYNNFDNSDSSIEIRIEERTLFSVSVDPDLQYGTVSTHDGSGVYPDGDNVYMAREPAHGYRLSEYYVLYVSDGASQQVDIYGEEGAGYYSYMPKPTSLSERVYPG